MTTVERRLLLSGLLGSAVTVAMAGPAGAAPGLRNWFDDPFFQLSAEVVDCPLPRGPFMTESERRQQAHRRIENGTSCFLAGECDRPNAYAYDRDIAAELRRSMAAAADLRATTLWVTVQGRVVYIEGCAASADSAAAIERLAWRVQSVRHVSVSVRARPDAPLPYRPMSPKRSTTR
jgi:hypothetical protein